jgi:hypothetical protein
VSISGPYISWRQPAGSGPRLLSHACMRGVQLSAETRSDEPAPVPHDPPAAILSCPSSGYLLPLRHLSPYDSSDLDAGCREPSPPASVAESLPVACHGLHLDKLKTRGAVLRLKNT